MSTISSVSSNLTSSIRGFGGLASGLDRDTLIEQFTAGTRSKIAQQKQKQQKLQWTQEAIRNITDKIYNFTNSFTSYSSSSNLTSTKLFSRSVVNAVGENSKYVSVTGTAASAENMSISRIKKLATNATMNTGSISAQSLTTADLGVAADGTLNGTKEISTIEGDALFIKYGNSTYSVSMAGNAKDAVSAADMINDQLKTVEISGNKTLADVMKAEVSNDGKLSFSTVNGAYGNRLELAGGTGDILQDLGFLKEGQKFSDLSEDQISIGKTGSLTASGNAVVTETSNVYELLSDKSVTFSYNGKKADIKTATFTAASTIEDVRADFQSKLDEAFGKNRIKVETDGKSLSFKTMMADGGAADNYSTLSVTSGTGIVGTGGLFGIPEGASNRINLSASVDKAGFKAANFSSSLEDDGSYYMSINGVKIEGITKDSTVSEIMNKINSSKAGVKVSYQSLSDQFVITSTQDGASGAISFDGDSNGKANLAALMFGTLDATNYTKGQDAVLSVKYPGSNEGIEITRGTNSFDLDGINVTLKGTFGYDKAGNEIDNTEAITFTAKVDTETTTKAVKDMIDGFNEILKLVNTEVSTKPDRDYAPLTDEQKEEMSEKTIEKWEEKAKAGLLFADSDLRMMANSMRTVINSADRNKLAEMGITVSSSYRDNGKLVFDEEKFKTALEKDPDAVRELLNRQASSTGDTSQAGLLTRITTIMDNYGKTTGANKGILINRAGSVHSPTSVLTNSIQKQLDSLDDYIEKLNDRLATEQDRYISQFTTLETLINQMNSQSSYLSSMFTY